MRESANGLGGKATILYSPSTAFTNYPGFGARMVATSVTTEDGLGGSSTATYSYGGGNVNRQERRSLGFQTSRTTLPCIGGESACPYVDTTFAQTLPSAGQPLEVKKYAGGGTLLSKQTNVYTETAWTPTTPRKSLLTKSDSYAYGGGEELHSYATFAYDAYANQTQAVQYGDVTVSGDELQTDFTYYPNTSAYIVSKPAKVERRAPGGTALQVERFGYDTQAWTSPPTKGDLTSVSRWRSRDGAYVTSATTYSTKGDVLTATDETGRTVTTEYWATADFLPRYIRNALNETTELTWDHRCQAIVSTKDPNNRVTSQTYDPLCRPDLTTDPATGTVKRLYQNLGTPTTQKTRTETKAATGVSGVDWVEESFDGLGRTYRTRKRGPASGQEILVDRTFNPRGALLSSKAPYYNGETVVPTTYEYDAADRLTRMVLPDQNDVMKSYTARSVTTTDPKGKEVTTRSDGRTVEVEENGNVTTTTYDLLGQRTGIEDAAGNTWTYTYDSLGRLWHEYDPDAGHWEYDYDAAGRPTWQRDAKSQVTTMTYDAVGRIATKGSPAGSVTYTYSADRGTSYFNKGRLTTVTSPSDTLELNYDNLGRVTMQRRQLAGSPTWYAVTKAWDAGGYLQSTSYPDGLVVDGLGYDEAGRLNSIAGLVDNVTYDAAGRPLVQDNANGTLTTRTHSPTRGFLTNIVTTSPSGTLQNLVYDYDDAGLVESVTSSAANEGWTYGYDNSYRLTSATNHTNPAYNQTWTYDSLGRITYNSRTGVGNYTYPGAGQPRPHAPLTVNGASMTYDLNGNLTTGASRTIAWDAENRVSQATSGGVTTTFTYDAFGERLKKVSGATTSITPFGDDYEVTNGVISKYLSVEGLGLILRSQGEDVYWVHTDRLGSITAETNASGQVPPALSRTYRPYGETLTSSGSLTESRGFIDQRNDTTTGLTYLHARYFDPKLGQFLSPDPIGPAGGLNAFAYGFGDPINSSDRSGLRPNVCLPGEICRGGDGSPTDGSGGFEVEVRYDPVSGSYRSSNPSGRPGPNGGSGGGIDPFGLARFLMKGFREWMNSGNGRIRPPISGNPTSGTLPAPAQMPDMVIYPDRVIYTVPESSHRGPGEGWTVGEKALGYLLHGTYVPAAWIDSLLPEHDRDNWFDRALDSVSPGEAAVLGIAGSIGPIPKGPRGLQHSFSRHSAQWFGREVSAASHLAEWATVIEEATRRGRRVNWSLRGAPTTGHLAKIDGKYFFAQYFQDGPRAGELASAFVPQGSQLAAILAAIEKTALEK
jgi:RHS repeat-associated protein